MILTLYFTKDKTTFKDENFESIKAQQDVEQDIYIVSAEPLGLENNIIVPVSQKWPVPIKIGVSFNVAIRKVSLSKYTHIFKVDGDILLPEDYLKNLISKKTFVAGIGAAMLISVPFFLSKLSGRYPISYCDDGYIFARSLSLGVWVPQYDGEKTFSVPKFVDLKREFLYGREYYKWGMPGWLLIVSLILSVTRSKRLKEFQRRTFKQVIFNLAGYLSAMIRREKKYEWSDEYRKMRIRHFAENFIPLL